MKLRYLTLALAVVAQVWLFNGCGKKMPASVVSGQGYQRTVLVELFTSEFCTNCPKADAAAESLAAEMGDTLCLVQLHPVMFQSSGDSLGLAAADTLAEDYESELSSQGLPFFSCDGLENIMGTQTDVEGTYHTYRQRADLRKTVFSPLSMRLNAALDQETVTYSLKIESGASLDQNADLGLVVMVVEDSVNAYGKTFRYVGRTITPGTKGEPLSLEPSASLSKSGTIVRNPGWLPWRLSLIAYVRNNQTREILQAAKARIYAAVTAPAVPVLDLPKNDSNNVTLNPALYWLASSGAASYTAHLATDSLFNNLVRYPGGLTATSVTLTGLQNSTTYYWRVNASNNAGTSAWSAWRRFTTTATSLPAAPALLSPLDGDTGVSKSPTLSWSPASGAVNYGLELATSSSFYPASLVYSRSGISGTSCSLLGLNPATVYYWRVNAANLAGPSAWSSVRSFTTTASPAPEAPTPIIPDSGALNAALDPSLSLVWSSSYGAASYGLQISPYNDFRYALIDQSSLADTTRTVNGLDSLTTYCWRTNAANTYGTSDWSAIWKFTDARGYGFSRVITSDSVSWLPDTIISYSLSDPETPELGFHFFLTNLSARMAIYAQAPTALNSDSTLFWGFLCTESGCQGPNGIASSTFNAGATQHWTVHFSFNTTPPPAGLHYLVLKLWAADNPAHVMSRKLYVEVLP
jgi:hypothetical protein